MITFFFTERDFGAWPTETYGLRRKDGTAKADYSQFKQLNPRLSYPTVSADGAQTDYGLFNPR